MCSMLHAQPAGEVYAARPLVCLRLICSRLALPLPQALHLILVTSSEVSDLRQALRDIQEEPSGAGSRVFKALYSCWCHSAGGRR